MKTQKIRNGVLALVALAALSVYIMACTSFSPDDSKVLYPAFDPGSGVVGMAIYDRESKRSELAFVPMAYEEARSNAVVPGMMRGQWLADGRNLLIGYTSGKGNDGDGMNLAMVPSGGRGTIKLYRVPGLKDASALMVPLCVADERVFLRASPTEVARVDLKTGMLMRHEFAEVKKEICLYPNARGGLYYVEPLEGPDKAAIFGKVDPESLSRTPLMTITNEIIDKGLFAYDVQGKKMAFLEAGGESNRLVVIEAGKPVLRRSFAAEGCRWAFGSAGISPKGDQLWATFQKRMPGTNAGSYGFIEVPFNNAPVRETTLLAGAPADDEGDVFYFQGSVSHDGKAAAVCSTYLACSQKDFNAKDCALFLIDLADPHRKVTKVPVPVPAERPGIAGK